MECNFFCRDPLTQESWLAPSTTSQRVWALFGAYICQKRLCCKTTRSQSLHTTRHPGARDAISLTLKGTHKSLLQHAVYDVLVVKAEVGVFRL